MTEAEALLKYQTLSYELNARLWNREPLSDELRLHAEVLDAAISRCVSETSMMVFRGGTWRFGERQPGAEVEFLGFTSTTRHVGFTRQFMPSDSLPAARFTIHCPVGTKHAPIGQISGLSSSESEVLLPRGSRFEVLSARLVSDRSEIVQLVGPDPQHIHSVVWDVELRLRP